MSFLTVEVLPAEVEDAWEISTISYLARLPSDGAKVLFPPERVTQEEQVAFFAQAMEKKIRMMGTEEGRKSGLNVVKAVIPNGTIVGLGVWLIPLDTMKDGEGGDEEKKKDEGKGGENWPAGPEAGRLMKDLIRAAEPYRKAYASTGSGKLSPAYT